MGEVARVVGRSMRRMHWVALEALMGGATQEEAAAKAGVCVRTIRNWQKRPAFQNAERTLRERMLRDLSSKLHRNADGMLEALEKIAKDPGVTPAVRASALKTYLDQVLRTSERVDYAGRLNELEGMLAELRRA